MGWDSEFISSHIPSSTDARDVTLFWSNVIPMRLMRCKLPSLMYATPSVCTRGLHRLILIRDDYSSLSRQLVD
jgi:hypothetical protein